jgi:hypothetical protein
MVANHSIIEVTLHNLPAVWDILLVALREATFISIDAGLIINLILLKKTDFSLEFTGLGDNKQGTAAQYVKIVYFSLFPLLFICITLSPLCFL